MSRISLTVNGSPVSRNVEPRTNLADFLREALFLTGTHVGCEHGICGACTVVIDGEISRSCITWAVACDGADVRTIEGFDDDAIMVRLRTAFSSEHALQCGYCTPGMLIAARDLVRRHKALDERGIRELMSGNLCRCTGYMGIVRAVQSVLADRPADLPAQMMSRTLGPAPGPEAPDTLQETTRPAHPAVPKPVRQKTGADMPPRLRDNRVSAAEMRQDGEFSTLTQSITVAHPLAKVWAFMADIQKVASCMPGVTLDGPPDNGHVTGRLALKLGPIEADFAGEADVKRREQDWTGTIDGRARDARSSSRAKGRVEYVLTEASRDETVISVSISYSLAGPLAQFSRGALVLDFVSRLAAAFAQSLEARLSGREPETQQPARLDAGGLFFTVMWERFSSWLRRLFGGKG
ncbi:MAG: 2Fe-2S iron-sulfur cluster-binding protein [Pseudomonadota bacterium]|nr:2Fe-2S iron-sulfur cluster-binding protein [Pseudomonadota bacterium]